jgi:predicted alpha/beta-fold hydrolase
VAVDDGGMSTNATLVFGDDNYDPQLARTLTAVNAGMADLGEAMATAHQIGGKPSATAWYDAWMARADLVADVTDAATDPITRRDALLRASEYYRQAYFFLRHDLDDERLHEMYRRHVATFRQTLVNTDELAVPYAGVSLKAYLFRPSADHDRRPTILLPCGYDSTAEEGYAYATGALARGYNVVTFEGPGQGAALYLDGLTFQPDFAPVVTAVIDQIVGRPEIGQLVLHGLSFGGYLAPQAATSEHRLAALICNPAQPDMGAHVPGGIVGKFAPTVVRSKMKHSADKDEFFGSRMATHGVDDPADYFTELHRFNMIDAAARITCPTLILECEGDFAGGGGHVLAKAMTAPTTLIELTAADGAGGHCGGLGQKVWEGHVYNWLADTLIATPGTEAAR